MIDQTIKSLSDLIALRSFRRVLWILTILIGSMVILESQTQIFATKLLSVRADLLNKIQVDESDSKLKEELHEIRTSLVSEFKNLQARQKHPTTTLMAIFLRFAQGAYVLLPLLLLYFKMFKKTMAAATFKNQQQQPLYIFWFGMQGFSILTWVATVLGIISVVWNTSDNFIVSWIVFPFFSAIIFILFVTWVVLLKTIIPSEKAKT